MHKEAAKNCLYSSLQIKHLIMESTGACVIISGMEKNLWNKRLWWKANFIILTVTEQILYIHNVKFWSKVFLCH